MEIINNITYPILNFFGYPVLWEHPLFASIMENVPMEDTVDQLSESGKVFKEVGDKYDLNTKAWKTREKLTARRREAWPLLSFAQDDFNALGPEGAMSFDNFISQFWGLLLHDAVPEVVPPEVWDEAFEYDSGNEYDDWVGQKEFAIKGVMLRPYEKVTSAFFISNGGDGATSMSMCLFGGEVAYFHINGNGFISGNLELPNEVYNIARMRNVPPQVAYFQEDAYNILRYFHYSNVLGKGEKRILHRGDAETFHGTTYKSMTDTPLLFVTNR